jgi:hypothetical protein
MEKDNPLADNNPTRAGRRYHMVQVVVKAKREHGALLFLPPESEFRAKDAAYVREMLATLLIAAGAGQSSAKAIRGGGKAAQKNGR